MLLQRKHREVPQAPARSPGGLSLSEGTTGGATFAKAGPMVPLVGKRTPFASAPVQLLRDGATFAGQTESGIGQDESLKTICKLLDAHQTYNNGNDADGQKRLRSLRLIDTEIYAWFDRHVKDEIQNTPNAKAFLDLQAESEAEHRALIAEIAKNPKLLPVDASELGDIDQGLVLEIWRSIVEENGNIRILERKEGFRARMLAAIAKLLQGPNGRSLIADLNKVRRLPSKEAPSQESKPMPPDESKRVILSSSFAKELMNTQKHETPGNEAIPLPALAGKDETYKLQYVPEDRARTLDKKDVAVYDGDPRDPGQLNTFVLSVTKPFVQIDGSVYKVGQSTGSLVRIASKGAKSLIGTRLQEVLTPEFITVGHELGHAQRFLKGVSIPSDISLTQFGFKANRPEARLWHNAEEFVNINATENALRADHKLSPRSFHAGTVKNARGELNFSDADDTRFEIFESLGATEQKLLMRHPLFHQLDVMAGEKRDFASEEVMLEVRQGLTRLRDAAETLRHPNPESMYAKARPALQKAMDNDDEFKLYRTKFGQLWEMAEPESLGAARRIGPMAQQRLIALDFQVARSQELLLEDVDFEF